MADRLCNQFDTLRKIFRDELKDSKQYDFERGIFKKYCPNKNCGTDTDIANAGCLWLFNQFFGVSGISHYHDVYKEVTVFIMIWLSYKLSLKPPENITTLKDFYSSHIKNNEEYTKHDAGNSGYESHKKIIDEIEEYMNINISHMAKFDELLKLLCNMNTAYTKQNNSDFSKYSNKFVEEYEELLNDNNNIHDSSYSKVLLVLSNYYNNFEKSKALRSISIDLPQLPTEKRAQKVNQEVPKEIKTTETSSESDKLDTEMTNLSSNITLSGSSLVNKLVTVLSIFGAIAILLGVSYKYSLFGFRKRSQKQHLREKLKK
ncbi:uncharacterized protein PY17X_0946800 [Plasmodium yoelii]|uniref:Bir1 protein n=3 Tax=Plasmodium yoelii TaxID=5861 RepID=Q7RBW6_PLAYO|nr:uncharacterized protein PY17X_0946800 [Plasmodium yoelii]EAA18156.1 putative bir1 protein [Plasmodium yoelii yoelii]WBY57631.1 PIR protein [Plasmodium yoelii yoelii]CDU18233.1 YIR protein [Plasmodium yoelii]VTZ78650.1 PIR protein [Plasmodium yoelii]|eukprot:XP_726591.1 uncharacterized protein PY17X_0946800 [Plasmodium yoelii]